MKKERKRERDKKKTDRKKRNKRVEMRDGTAWVEEILWVVIERKKRSFAAPF